MPVSSGLSGFGTTLSWNGTVLAELKKIGGPKFKINTINLTSHASPSGFSEFAAGVGDAGEISIEGNLIAGDTAGQTALISDMVAKTARAFVITGPGSLFTWSGTAIVTAYEPSLNFDAEMSFTATLKITGLPTFGYTVAPNLTNLVLTTATLIPAFAGATKAYAATTTGTSYTVIPTCATADSITVNGATVASGVPSTAISTPSVGIYALMVVTKKAGYIDNTYTITVTKTA